MISILFLITRLVHVKKASNESNEHGLEEETVLN